MIKEHRFFVASRLKSGQQWSRVLFSLLCAERLRTCCWVFRKKYNINSKIVAAAYSEVFNFLVSGELTRDLVSLADELPKSIHTSEEYGFGLSVQAQCAMIALSNAVSLCNNDNIDLYVE